MSKEERMRWVPFTGDSSQRVPIQLEKEFATMPGGIGMAAWLRDCTERLAADNLRLVRVAKPDPCAPAFGHRVIEQCLPDIWQSPDHDDAHHQILERDQDGAWQYALISTSATAEQKKAIEPQAAASVLQPRWRPLSQWLNHVAAASGKPEDAWPEVSNDISEGKLPARGTYFGIDFQPLQPEWMRLRMWDDANDDAIFFRQEKGSDLLPPQRVPGHITNVGVCTAGIEGRWRPNAEEAAISSLADVKSVPDAGSKPSRSNDAAKPGSQGPKRGRLDRYGHADRALFPKLEEKMKTEYLSAYAAALQLAEDGKVAGTGAAKSVAKRLAGRFLKYGQKKPTETR
jgi:hypothetical protein